MLIEKNAGDFRIHAYTDGWPIWCHVEVLGERVCSPRLEDLRDLAYCVNRMVEIVEAHQAKIEARS